MPVLKTWLSWSGENNPRAFQHTHPVYKSGRPDDDPGLFVFGHVSCEQFPFLHFWFLRYRRNCLEFLSPNISFFILIMQAVSLKKMKINKQNNFTYLDLCPRGKSKRETWQKRHFVFPITQKSSDFLVIFEEVSTEFLNFYEFLRKKNQGIFSHF